MSELKIPVPSLALVNAVQRLFSTFRPPNDDPSSARVRAAVYIEEMAGYAPDDVQAVVRDIIRSRRDPFLPTVAELIEGCERAASLRTGKVYVSPEERAKRRAAAEAEMAALVGSTGKDLTS